MIVLIIGSFRRASHSERSCALFYKRWRTHLRVFSSPNKHWKGFSSSTTIVRSVLLHVLGVLARESCLIGNYSKRQLIPSSRCCSSSRVCVWWVSGVRHATPGWCSLVTRLPSSISLPAFLSLDPGRALTSRSLRLAHSGWCLRVGWSQCSV